MYRLVFFFFKQKTAYEIGTGDWSSDVCSSDLAQKPILSRSMNQQSSVSRRSVVFIFASACNIK